MCLTLHDSGYIYMKQWLLEQNTETLISLSIALIIGLFAFYLLYTILKYNLHKYQLESQISRLGIKQLKDITIDDGMDGEIQVERVFLTARGILAISTNFLSGNIFGDDKIDTWAQVIDKRTYRFPNPLYNFEHTLAALKHHFNDLTVEGKILFVGQCAFPTGQPLGALLIDDLEKHQHKDVSDDIDEHTKELWNQFEQTCTQSRAKKIELPEDKRLKQRSLISVTLLLISCVWFYVLIKQ